jgi:hypothetical protein
MSLTGSFTILVFTKQGAIVTYFQNSTWFFDFLENLPFLVLA